MIRTAPMPSLVVEVARQPEDVLAAQRLRYEVFAEELGAKLLGPSGRLDIDRFDLHCSHVLVREGAGGRVVACLRLLDGSGAMAAGGFYSQQEFDLSRTLTTLPGRLLEVGRICVAKDRRDGAALSALWTGLAREAAARGADHLIGCASVPFDPETQAIASLNASLRAYWCDESRRVFPRRPVPRDAELPERAAALPPLLAAYLRLGAAIGGEPSWDPEFGAADYFVTVSVEKLAKRYARRLLKQEDACAS